MPCSSSSACPDSSSSSYQASIDSRASRTQCASGYESRTIRVRPWLEPRVVVELELLVQRHLGAACGERPRGGAAHHSRADDATRVTRYPVPEMAPGSALGSSRAENTGRHARPIIRNLLEKTGRSIGQWADLVGAKAPAGHAQGAHRLAAAGARARPRPGVDDRRLGRPARGFRGARPGDTRRGDAQGQGTDPSDLHAARRP